MPLKEDMLNTKIKRIKIINERKPWKNLDHT